MQLPTLVPPQSYMAGSNLSYRVREFDPTIHEIIGESSSHNRYNCPYCLEVRGRPDDDGKFYWDREKLIGYCFKCTTVGILKSDRPYDEVKLYIILTSFISKLFTKTPDIPILTKIPYFKMFDPLDEEGKNYLLSRVPIYNELFDILDFRVSPKVGIAVPVYLDKMIVSYTLRFYKPTGGMKYFLPTGVKYLYSPNNALNFDNCYSEWTLCEGPFSAIGALLHYFKNPICLFGKTITPLQIILLRKYSPSIINIYLDETSLSWNLYHEIKKKFPTCSVINVIPSWTGDPEENFIKYLDKIATEEEYNKLLKHLENLKCLKEK